MINGILSDLARTMAAVKQENDHRKPPSVKDLFEYINVRGVPLLLRPSTPLYSLLLIALLIWRLIERCMRQYLDKTKSEITGWKKRPTKRPTSFMMTTKFLSILVAKSGKRRQLVKPLRPVQKEFLQAMGVNPEVFVNP